METSLVMFDARPLLTQVLEYGRLNGIFSDQRLAKLAEEGAKVSMQLADRYTSTVTRADLKKAQNLAIGCISLGLSKICTDLGMLAEIVNNRSLIELFRDGYKIYTETLTRHSYYINLSDFFKAQYDKSEEDQIFLDICECESGQSWNGYQAYLSKQKEIQSAQLDLEFYRWLITKAGVKNFKAYIVNLSNKMEEPGADLFLNSAMYWSVVSDEFKIVLNRKELTKIAKKINSASLMEGFLIQRWERFQKTVPEKYLSIVSLKIANLLHNNLRLAKENVSVKTLVLELERSCNVEVTIADIDLYTSLEEYEAGTLKGKRKVKKKL